MSPKLNQWGEFLVAHVEPTWQQYLSGYTPMQIKTILKWTECDARSGMMPVNEPILAEAP